MCVFSEQKCFAENVIFTAALSAVCWSISPMTNGEIFETKIILFIEDLPVECVGRHAGVHVPDPDGVVTPAGHEASGRQNRFLAVTQTAGVHLKGKIIIQPIISVE